jgi:cytochrome P450
LILTSTDIYGTGKNVRKSDSYVIHGPGNMLGLRDKAEHARKKRIFAQGFSDAAVREHEPKIIKLVNSFCHMISGFDTHGSDFKGWSVPRDMTKWCT